MSADGHPEDGMCLWFLDFAGGAVAALTNLDSIDDEPDNQSDDHKIEHHLNGDQDSGCLGLGRDVAKSDCGEHG